MVSLHEFFSYSLESPQKILKCLNPIQSVNIQELILYDANSAFDVKKNSSPTDKGDYTISDISLSNAIGGRIQAYYVKPKQKKQMKAVLFIHWLENHAENSNRLEFIPLAERFAKNGVASLLIDCFWSTTPEKFKANPVMWWKTNVEYDVELSRVQLIEIKRSIEFLQQDPDIDPNSLVLGAHDFGAMYSMTLASVFSNFKAYAFMAMTSRFHHWFKFGSKLPTEELDQYAEQTKFLDPIEYVDKINCPTLFQFSKTDFYVPIPIAEELFKKTRVTKEIKWYDADHGLNDQAFEDMYQWLSKYLN